MEYPANTTAKTRACIALLTDFGDRDGFVGVMKGVIATHAPDAVIVDIAHHILPQDVRHASWVLQQCFFTFPTHTVFVCVVDPGVGNPQQQALACYWPQQQKVVLCPDNGMVTRLMRSSQTPDKSVKVFSLNHQIPSDASRTFLGRDLYAPQAATLAKHTPEFASYFETLPPVDKNSLIQLPLADSVMTENRRYQGEVDIIDRYGNLITNFDNCCAVNPLLHSPNNLYKTVITHCQNHTLTLPIVRCYDALAHTPDGLGVVQGSHGCLEIAAYQGSAWQKLRIPPGEPMVLQFSKFGVLERNGR